MDIEAIEVQEFLKYSICFSCRVFTETSQKCSGEAATL
jgi:hypothetical protein